MSLSTAKTPAVSSRFAVFMRLVAGLIVLLLVAGFLYENISEARDRRFNPMPGRRVDIGGYKLHLNCGGQGTPAVIFDSGLGDSYAAWRKVRPEMAKLTQACSYDRGGIGWSDSSPRSRDSRVFAEELHTLLHNAGISGPYILVGHSMAGFDVRLFTSLYRNEVAGIVLVDSSHPEQIQRFPQIMRDIDNEWTRQLEFMEFTMPIGIPRALGFCGGDIYVRAAECDFSTMREKVAENKNFGQSAAEAATTGPFGDLPLMVLSHDPTVAPRELPPDVAAQTEKDWSQMQQELTHLSARSTQVIAQNSGHYIQSERPELVIQAISSMVEQVRQKQNVAPH